MNEIIGTNIEAIKAETSASSIVNTAERNETQKYWTFGVRMPYEVKERLDRLTKAEYKALVNEIREVLASAKPAAEK